MRVLQILDVRWDSGIMRYGLNLAAALQERGHRVRVWALPGRPPYVEAQRLGLPAASCARPLLRGLALRADLLAEPVDVVNTHSGSGHTLAAVLNATLPRPFALVRTRGDARPLERRAFAGWLWRRTHGFIAANERILADYRAALPGGPPARLVPWGLDWPDPGPPGSDAPVRLGMVARLDPVKGHATLLSAFARVRAACPGTELWLAGEEVGITAAQLQEQARTLGIDGGLRLLGRVERVRAFMRDCHIGVAASLGSEAVSRAAVEWLASGRPLVASRVGCLPETVAGNSGVLVDPGDAAGLAEALIALVRDPARRAALGRGARARYEARYRTERFVEDTLQAYTDALHHLPHR